MFPLLANVVFPALISSIGWGVAPYYDKRALEFIDNNSLFLLRNVFVGLITLILMIIFYKKIKITQNLKKSAKFVLYSTIASLLVGSYFYYYALEKTNNTVLVVLISFVLPLVFITLLSSYKLKEKINLGMIIGLILVIIGISIFVCNSNT